MKTFNEFQTWACDAWFGPKDNSLVIPALGVAGEAGEVADKVKKVQRGDNVDPKSIAVEISDVLFYCAILADRLGWTLAEVAQMQVDKINGRIERGTRRGEGDSR